MDIAGVFDHASCKLCFFRLFGKADINQKRMFTDAANKTMITRSSHRRCIALLVGWFLMISPMTTDWPWHRIEGAPLKHYYSKHDVPFASQQECEVDKKRVIMHIRNSSALNDTYYLGLYYYYLLQCIPSDDPRMKGDS